MNYIQSKQFIIIQNDFLFGKNKLLSSHNLSYQTLSLAIESTEKNRTIFRDNFDEKYCYSLISTIV